MFEKGKVLAQGKGINNMLNTSLKKNLSNFNSILEVEDDTNVNSNWKIYEKKYKSLN